ncbi:hypothetical protein THOM_2940 [Trachipleistophora hominis]|uniref:Uncharacterized protein n=1 Tax=Trachipleistophora hominis TaxID=72359 RepID=L7JTR2_TRAHO|nr:hypothetical protein THOM_2940 [Trachipleistophora hominis]
MIRLQRKSLLKSQLILFLSSVFNMDSDGRVEPSFEIRVNKEEKQVDDHGLSYFYRDENEFCGDTVLNEKVIIGKNIQKGYKPNPTDYNESFSSEGDAKDKRKNNYKQIRFLSNNINGYMNDKDDFLSQNKKLRKAESNKSYKFSYMDNQTDKEKLCLEDISLVLKDEYLHQMNFYVKNKFLEPDDVIITPELVIAIVDTFAYNLKDNYKQDNEKSIVQDAENYLKCSLTLCFYWDSSIHAIFKICGDILNEATKSYGYNAIKTDDYKYTLVFKVFCTTLESIYEEVDGICDKLTHEILILLSSLSEQYNNDPKEIKQPINDNIQYILLFHLEVCRALRKNLMKVQRRLRITSILVSSRETKKKQKEVTNLDEYSISNVVIKHQKHELPSMNSNYSNKFQIFEELGNNLSTIKFSTSIENDQIAELVFRLNDLILQINVANQKLSILSNVPRQTKASEQNE